MSVSQDIQDYETAYRMSKFAHLIPVKPNTIAIYHSLLMKTVFVSKNIVGLLDSFRTGIVFSRFLDQVKDHNRAEEIEQLINRLVELRLLVPVRDDEDAALNTIRSVCTREPEITSVYVMLTDKCNFACDYCFVEEPLPTNHQFAMMEPEVATQAIDRFVAWCNPELTGTIMFYGGEPLLNRPALYAALDRIQYHLDTDHLKPDLKIILITNGSLIDEEYAEKAKQFNIKTSVSIDGTPKFHDKCRRTRNGEPTHHLAVRGFRILQDADASVGISMTIGQHQVGHLMENVMWPINELGVKSIGLNMLLELDPNNPIPQQYFEDVSQEIIECFKVLRKLGIYEERVMRKVECFIEGIPYAHDCSGCGHQVVISPTGKVGVCHGYAGWEKYFVDPDENFNPVEHPFWQEWVERSPINMPQCRDCEALGICGGGCACVSDMKEGSIWAVNTSFCIHAKSVLRWMLEEICP